MSCLNEIKGPMDHQLICNITSYILILSTVWKIPNDALLFCQGFHWWTCATQMELLPCNVRCDVHVPRVRLQLMYIHFTLVYLVVGLHLKKDRHPDSIVHMCTQVNHRSYCWLNSRPYMCDYIIWIQCVYANGHVFFWFRQQNLLFLTCRLSLHFNTLHHVLLKLCRLQVTLLLC